MKDLQDLIAYQTKVSNNKNQDDLTNAQRLLKYCAQHSHWSPFEMGNLTFEIETPRDISRQVLRHRSFSFQEFSQRYSEAMNFTVSREPRMQDPENRQNSIETDDPGVHEFFKEMQAFVLAASTKAYHNALEKGIAKECARVLLPEGLTMSKMYVNGTVRSWIHYIKVREANGTQKEHTEIALKIKELLLKELPVLKEVLEDE